MITAEEFLVSKSRSKNNNIVLNCLNNGQFTSEMMIEFAKLHVKEALKQASEKAQVEVDNLNYLTTNVDKDSILNAYSLDNIK